MTIMEAGRRRDRVGWESNSEQRVGRFDLMHHLAQSSILNHQESRELGGVLNAHMGCAHVGWLQVSPLTLSGYFQT